MVSAWLHFVVQHGVCPQYERHALWLGLWLGRPVVDMAGKVKKKGKAKAVEPEAGVLAKACLVEATSDVFHF